MFRRVPRDKTVDVFSSAVIECSSDGAVITWYKDGKLLGPSNEYQKNRVTGYLHIFMVQADDAGTYTCVAKNAAGRVHASMQLKVREQ